MTDKSQTQPTERRKDIADLLWLLVHRRRNIIERTRRQHGILQDAAWRSVDKLARQINIVREVNEIQPKTTEKFKVLWCDGYDRETIADKILVENLGVFEANAICRRLRAESGNDADWWKVTPQETPAWRGMEEFV